MTKPNFVDDVDNFGRFIWNCWNYFETNSFILTVLQNDCIYNFSKDCKNPAILLIHDDGPKMLLYSIVVTVFYVNWIVLVESWQRWILVVSM